MSDAIYKRGTDGTAIAAGRAKAHSDAIHNNTQLPILTRGVIVEVFHDMSTLDEEARNNLNIKNEQVLPYLRRNCLLVKELGESQTDGDLLCLPLFDPYISLPFKPGETVFILREDENRAPNEIPYVLCRIPTASSADDVNYTHDDRKYIETQVDLDAVQKQQAATQDPQAAIENFESGQRDVDDSFTIGTTKEAFDDIWNASNASKKCVLEPVARFTKLPGDQTFQGSNNNVINFTIDRQNLSLSEALTSQRGAIDIVVGRGYNPDYTPNETTAPLVVDNSRNAQEVDKTPHLRNKTDVPTEGNPDFTNDPSRIYIAMKSDVDKRFGIDIQNVDELQPGPLDRTGIFEQEKPGIVLKTTQLRLVGREDVKIQADSGDGNGAAIVLRADGNIYLIPGPNGHILLGGADAGIAPLCSAAAKAGGGIAATTITDTMGATHGAGALNGTFTTKVLMK